MNSQPLDTTLQILQINANNSDFAQQDLLNDRFAEQWDVIVIQEPYKNFLGNTRATHRWHVVYP
ncbi:hypothetical protein CONPUDRAFT_47317, partial [Coniophora puteana RWD-64-598 SS2]